MISPLSTYYEANGKMCFPHCKVRQLDPMISSVEFDCVFFDDYPLEDDDVPAYRSRWHQLLDQLIYDRHLAQYGRVTGYLSQPLEFHYPSVDVSISRMQVQVPQNCTYYPHQWAFIPLLTLQQPEDASDLEQRLKNVRYRLENFEYLEHEAPEHNPTSTYQAKGFQSRKAYLEHLRISSQINPAKGDNDSC